MVGGGLELASACHIRVADETTFYALPEGSRGIFVGGGGSVRIPQLIGAARMTDMMLTGRVYNAEDGERAGFAQYLVPQGQAFDKALELAKRVAQNAPLTNYALMHALPRIAEQPADQGFFTEALMAGHRPERARSQGARDATSSKAAPPRCKPKDAETSCKRHRRCRRYRPLKFGVTRVDAARRRGRRALPEGRAAAGRARRAHDRPAGALGHSRRPSAPSWRAASRNADGSTGDWRHVTLSARRWTAPAASARPCSTAA